MINERLILTDLNGVLGDGRITKYTSFDENGSAIEHGSEKEVLRVYEDGYDVVDVRHLGLSHARLANLNAIKYSLYKVQFINKDIGEQDMFSWIKEKVKFYSIGKEDAIDITDTDLHRLCSETFGYVLDESSMIRRTYTFWTKSWTNVRIEKALNRYGKNSVAYFDIMVKERASFSRQCWNKTQQKKSQDKFIDAVMYVYERYGYYSNELVADVLEVSETYTATMSKRYRSMLSEIPLTTMKSINAQNRVLKSGEAVHNEDRELITKKRVENKSAEIGDPVSYPTVLKHWKTVEPHFIMLNEKLYRELT